MEDPSNAIEMQLDIPDIHILASDEDEIKGDYNDNDTEVIDSLSKLKRLEMSEAQSLQEVKKYEEEEEMVNNEMEEKLPFNQMMEIIEEEETESEETEKEEKEKYEITEDKEEIEQRPSLFDERLHVITLLKELMEERKILKLKSGFLQKKYCDIIRSHKIKNVLEKTVDPFVIYKDESYQAILEQYGKSKKQIESKELCYKTEIRKMEEAYTVHQSTFEEMFSLLVSCELEVGTSVVSSTTGKRLEDQKVQRILERQKMRVADLANMRFVYLKLRNQLADMNACLNDMNKVPSGYTIMDYDQLAMQKQFGIEKLEEKDRDIQKCRQQCFAYVSILGHMKESIDTLISGNMAAAANLAILTETLGIQRFYCIREKQNRDAIRRDIVKLQETMDVLSRTELLNKMKQSLQEKRAKDKL